MKIAVVSDTHGNYKELLEILKEYKDIQMIFHLGDYVEDGEKIGKALSLPTVIVKGNGDHWSNYNEDEIIELKNKKIFLTHGHRYNVRFNNDNLYYKGLEVGADVVLLGHTHVPIIEDTGTMIIMNPGSPSSPRTPSRKKTFGIIEINDDITAKIIEI